LKDDLDSIEERARNDMGLIKSDETFYLIVDE
jgi:cell division protein FtsB